MIINKENQTKLQFGTGDICVTGGHIINENGQVVGITTFSRQEDREIGRVGDIKAGQVYDLKEFPVLMTFSNPDSIDVVMRALQCTKDEMGSMRPGIVTDIESCNGCEREYNPHITGGIVNGHPFCQDCLVGMAVESAKLTIALEKACDDMADGCCPYDTTDDYESEECKNCPNRTGNRENSQLDYECWKKYYLKKATE